MHVGDLLLLAHIGGDKWYEDCSESVLGIIDNICNDILDSENKHPMLLKKQKSNRPTGEK